MAAYQSRLKLVSNNPDPADGWQERTRRAHGQPETVNRRIGGIDDPSGWNKRDAAHNDRNYARGGGVNWQNDPRGMPSNMPFDGPSVIDLDSGKIQALRKRNDDEDGTSRIELGDGSVVIDINPFDTFNVDVQDEPDTDRSFYDNLALDMDESDLAAIAAEIMDGIQQDEVSRADMLETRQKGIKLLGLRIEEPRGDTGTSSAPLEGMSTVRHSLLLEACASFQAGARAELLPSDGPVKIRVDAAPGAPSSPPGQPPQGMGNQPLDELAEALQTDMNHYLTVTLSHYVPDTDRMFFVTGLGGDGFKKLYHDPLKRRPTSIAVDFEDLIVSNMATDIENCGRVTHRTRMRPSVLRRMQLLGTYRDIHLNQAVADQPDKVKQEIADIMGARPNPMRPKDVDYTLYESYVELDLDEFAPRQFRGKGLPLPYRVTIEKDSRQILEITRNWKEDDPLCEARKTFVQYPFIPALGFYSLGFLHLLGNTALALTAATREMLDAGMFANFPGVVYAKQVGRQLTNQFRCPPGGGIGIDLPAGAKVSDVVSPLPYKEVGPAFPAFIQHIEQNGRQLAMVANAPVAEGKQDAPVGTTLALIEQQTKVIGSAFKRLHIAQSKEFQILVDLFREDPEAFWRGNKKPAMKWTKQQLLAALSKYELVPVADPNNPTSLHRMAKAAMLKTLQAANPQLYDPMAVDRRVLMMANIDPEGLFKGPQPQAPDPMMMMLQARAQLEQLKLQIKDRELQIKALTAAMQQQGKAADRASKERIELLKQQIVQMQAQEDAIQGRLKNNAELIKHIHGLVSDQNQDARDGQLHQQKLDQQDDLHQQRLYHKEATHQQGLLSFRQNDINQPSKSAAGDRDAKSE